MSDLKYPIRVVFYGGEDWEGIPLGGYDLHTFRRPGELYRWAEIESGYISATWQEERNVLESAGFHPPEDFELADELDRLPIGVKRALDEWAALTLRELDYDDGSECAVLCGEKEWQEWQAAQPQEEYSRPPVGWRAVGPIRSCGCEDWPCCGHTDDYMYVP